MSDVGLSDVEKMGRALRQALKLAVDTVLPENSAHLLVRIGRDVVGGIDELCGRPFHAPPTLEASEPSTRREGTPVMVYFDGKDHRTKKRVEDLLLGASISYRVLDVSDDEATRSWALSTARREEFPVIFVAGEPLGGFDELLELEVNGGLRKRILA